MRSSVCCSVLSLFILLVSNNSVASSDDKASPEPFPQIDSTSGTLDSLIEKQRLAIDEIEFQDGVYGSKLTQELLNLGTVYQNLGKHEDAIEILNRSLHLNRINEGLYSAGQIPILEKIIISLKQLKRWQSVSDRYYYQYWLYARNFEENDIEMLEIDFKLANWYLHAYSLKVAPNPTQDLLNSFTLFDKAAGLISNEYGENDIRIIEALNGLMIANYFVATHIESIPPEVDLGSNTPKLAPNAVSKIQYLKRKSFSKGRHIIERELKILLSQSTPDHLSIIKTKLRLADWHLMYDKRQSAMKYYRQAYDYALTNDPANEAVNQLFTQPVALPDFPNLDNNTSINLSEQGFSDDVHYVHAVFNVTKYGKAKNVKIIDSNPPENTSMRAKVLRNLRVAKFRPRFTDGIPVTAEQTQIHVFVN